MCCEIIFYRWMVYGVDYTYDNSRLEACRQFFPVSRIIRCAMALAVIFFR